MNLFKMKKEEYEKFRLFVNVSVFIAFLAVFIFVELKNIQARTIFSGLIATVVLSSVLMMVGILTIFPAYSAHFGKTLVAFSALIFLGDAIQIFLGMFSMFVMIEIVLAFASFLYGKELSGERTKFISLNIVALNTGKKK